MNRKEMVVLPMSAYDGHSSSYTNQPTLHRRVGSNKVNDVGTLSLPDELVNRMFQHQKEGVEWMHQLHHRELGGILGDDMGLGKTFQVACLLTGLFRTTPPLIQRVLIVCPVSVLSGWQRELLEHLVPHVKRVALDMVTSEMAKKRRQKVLSDVFLSRMNRIVITSYQLLSNMVGDFAEHGTWDYVILDEGNPSVKTLILLHILSFPSSSLRITQTNARITPSPPHHTPAANCMQVIASKTLPPRCTRPCTACTAITVW